MSILHRAPRCALATIALAALSTPLREATAQAPAAPLRAMEPASDVVHAAPAAPRKKREPASFNGIQPGTATLADVNEAWGRPLKVARRGSASEQVYHVEPFARVEVTFEKDRVVSIVIQLKQALETKELATQLELIQFEPVTITDEADAEVGLAYPERAVSFGFVAADRPQQVSRIVLDLISAEPFLLRAAARRGVNDTLCLDDVQAAMDLSPKSARPLVLRAQALRATGHFDAAVKDCQAAEALEPKNPEHRLLHAAILADMGRYETAIATTQQALALCNDRPEMRAWAMSQLGDQTAAGPKHDYKQALEYHMQAIQYADAVVADRRATVRHTACDAMLEAHLGAANDIAQGHWDNKQAVVAKWLESSEQLAAATRGTRRRALDELKLCRGALSACALSEGKIDPTPWLDRLEAAGRKRLESIDDPQASAALGWELGAAMSDAMLAYQLRSDGAGAERAGAMAVANLEQAIPHRGRNNSDTASLGWVYFRMGSVAARDKHSHAQAIGWFDRAVPLVEDSLPTSTPSEVGRQGEALVSMAVSYWELGRHDRALELTQRGADCIQKAVDAGALDKQALSVPYANLAAIHKHQGNKDRAQEYTAQADKLRGTTLK